MSVVNWNLLKLEELFKEQPESQHLLFDKIFLCFCIMTFTLMFFQIFQFCDVLSNVLWFPEKEWKKPSETFLKNILVKCRESPLINTSWANPFIYAMTFQNDLLEYKTACRLQNLLRDACSLRELTKNKLNFDYFNFHRFCNFCLAQ